MRSLVFIFAALLAWGAALARSAQVFAPDSVYVQPFNSDSALPVLMANDPRIDLFRAYVYGQDQIGAYPFLACQLFARATRYVWTIRSIYLLQVFWLFLSPFAVAALARRTLAVAPALFVAALCLHPTTRHYVFVLNQRYAWQITPLLFAWWTYRKLCAHLSSAPRAAARPAGTTTLLWSLASLAFSFLAVWASPLSAPMLACFLALEAARAPAAATDERRDLKYTAARLLACALPLASAVACERLLKAAYHRHALRHFGTDFSTPTQIDWGHVAENLRAQLSNLTAAPAWWLVVPALVAAPVLCVALVRRYSNGVAHDQPGLRLEDARLDAAVLMLGALSAALVNFAAAFLFLWIRLNSYGGRYLALTHLFGAFAGLLALFLLATLHPRIYAARRVVFPAVAAACALVVAIKFPPVAKNPDYENLKEIAAAVAARAPGSVLLGGYWDTYVFAALEPAARFVPVPAQDQLLRTPWTAEALRRAPRVLVVHHHITWAGDPETPLPYDTFGDGRQPPQLITQYGASLRLDTPRWFEQHGYVFTLYDNAGPP